MRRGDSTVRRTGRGGKNPLTPGGLRLKIWWLRGGRTPTYGIIDVQTLERSGWHRPAGAHVFSTSQNQPAPTDLEDKDRGHSSAERPPKAPRDGTPNRPPAAPRGAAGR